MRPGKWFEDVSRRSAGFRRRRRTVKGDARHGRWLNGDGRPTSLQRRDRPASAEHADRGFVAADSRAYPPDRPKKGGPRVWRLYDNDGHPDLFVPGGRPLQNSSTNDGRGSFNGRDKNPAGDWARFEGSAKQRLLRC